MAAAKTRTVSKWGVRILVECFLVTGRNEVVAKVIFLHLSVIHSVDRGEGVCLSACWDTNPPGPDPPGPDTPDQTPPSPWDEAHPPRARHPPWHQAHLTQTSHPPRKQTLAYGLQAAGTHPTAMHSCLPIFSGQTIRRVQCRVEGKLNRRKFPKNNIL